MIIPVCKLTSLNDTASIQILKNYRVQYIQLMILKRNIL